MTLKIYTDSSFSHTHGIAACGFVVCNFNETILKHEVFLIDGLNNNTHAEAYAIYLASTSCIEFCPEKVIIYCDNTTIVDGFNKRRKQRVRNEFLNSVREIGKTKDMFVNKNIAYEIKWVKAHNNHPLNTKVDSSVRNQLRTYLKSLSIDND